MLIKKYGYLNRPRPCINGDIFCLWVDGIKVYEEAIAERKVLEMWAYIDIDGAVGFIVGDDTLLESLLERGFRHDRK
jgi:hypothetical protein